MVTSPEVTLRETSEIQQQQRVDEDILGQARLLVSRGQVKCRRNRAAVVQCDTKEEFLARLHCIRRASTIMFGRPEVLTWIQENGRDLMSRVIRKVRWREVITSSHH